MATTINDIFGRHDRDLGGLSFVYLLLTAFRNPPNHDPHDDRCLPFPPSWLQLLATFLVIVILILVVQVLHLLCL